METAMSKARLFPVEGQLASASDGVSRERCGESSRSAFNFCESSGSGSSGQSPSGQRSSVYSIEALRAAAIPPRELV
jgi:hypothetical protein